MDKYSQFHVLPIRYDNKIIIENYIGNDFHEKKTYEYLWTFPNIERAVVDYMKRFLPNLYEHEVKEKYKKLPLEQKYYICQPNIFQQMYSKYKGSDITQKDFLNKCNVIGG